MQTISKKSFIFRVAYGSAWYTPSQVSICQLCQKFLSRGFLLIVLGVLGVATSAIAFVIGAPIALLCGYRWTYLDLFWKENQGDLCREYRLPEVFGKRLWPIVPVSLLALGWCAYRFEMSDLPALSDYFQPVTIPYVQKGGITLLYAGAFVILGMLLHHFETCRALVFGLKTWWKGNVCVTLRVVD